MMDPQAQAEAELAALEEKKKAKEEKDKKKEVEHLTHMMRSGQRNQEDSASCANLLCGWGILNGLLWAVPLLGDNWWNKIWHGMSIDKLTVGVGLFNMEVHLQCSENMVGETSLCYAMKKYADHDNGHWAILEIQEEMCGRYKGSCATMSRLYQAGFAPLVLLPAAAAFEVLAILLLYFYWHGKPTALIRGLANKCASLAPFIGVMGFTGWMICSPYLQELPRYWAAEAGHMEFANSSLFGLQESFTLPMGWCCLMVFFNMISSAIRFFIQFTLPFHINEPDPTGMGEETRLLTEAEKMYD